MAEVDPMRRSRLDQAWGCGDPDLLFGSSQRTTTPWTRGGKDRNGSTFDRVAVADLLAVPVGLVDVDPRTVRCSQPWLVREHVDYYLSGRWELSGRTSADQHLEGNRFPIIVPDRDGSLVILSGHHRTAAALIQGRPVRARIAARETAFYVTPRILVDPGLSHRVDPAETVVADLDDATSVLVGLGVPAGDIDAAIKTASRRLERQGDDPNV
jgi:hypothetical protein